MVLVMFCNFLMLPFPHRPQPESPQYPVVHIGLRDINVLIYCVLDNASSSGKCLLTETIAKTLTKKNLFAAELAYSFQRKSIFSLQKQSSGALVLFTITVVPTVLAFKHSCSVQVHRWISPWLQQTVFKLFL